MKALTKGDKVKIRNDLTPGKVYGRLNATERMCKFAGQEVTVDVVSSIFENQFTIKEYRNKYHNLAYFTFEMLDIGLDETTEEVLETIKNLEID